MEERKKPPQALHAWLIMLKASQSITRYVLSTMMEGGLGESDFRVLEVLLHKGYADDLATLIETLDLKNATLVGHSTGGGEVARYIGRHGCYEG